MMTLEEAIKHCKDVALSCTNKECALEHFQLLKWLQEYSNMLEKQGEHAKFCDSIQVGDKVTRNQDGVLVNLSQLKRVAKPSDDTEKQGKNNMGISEATKKKLEDNLHKALEKETPESWNKFLEGEQNHTEKIEPKFKVGDIIRFKGNETLKGEAETHKIVSYDNELYVFADGTTDLFCEQDLYELVEQNPTDKVEPKFKVGDWITNGKLLVGQVTSFDGEYYHYIQEGIEQPLHISNAYNWHLWTIQDAKDGDVLCCESGWTCIFKALNSDISFSSYCFMDDTGWFCETGSESHTLDKAFIKAYNGNIYPATKEQRDTLMKAMADAGYTFDFEKKELKKIELESTWNEKIKGLNELETYILSLVPDRSLDAIKVDAKNIRYVINKEQKPSWSEEDKDFMYDTLSNLTELKDRYDEGYGNVGKCIDWLKSLKERVQPQPKQEWSEEDENRINRLIAYFEDKESFTAEDDIVYANWLKSLRPQNWKPSEEQMKALKEAVDEHFDIDGGALWYLYEDLKKLNIKSYESKRNAKENLSLRLQ